MLLEDVGNVLNRVVLCRPNLWTFLDHVSLALPAGATIKKRFTWVSVAEAMIKRQQGELEVWKVLD